MADLIKIPGMLDPHVHLRDMDWAHKATFASETAAALAGGYWAIFDMPNTPPTTISQETLSFKRSAIAAQAHCDWGIYAGASQSNNTAEYAAMADASCGLKIFNNATTGDLLLSDQAERALHYAAWPAHRIIVVHAEGDTVREILELVRQFRRHTHFLHISTAEEISYLRAAKEEGLPVTLGVCPHHLYLTEADEATLKGFGIMKPSLKTPADRDTLWQALHDGLVDIIESDHAPHTRAEKESEKPPFGVPGLETNLPLMLTAIHERGFSLEQILPLFSDNPRRIWGLACPPDTYALVDLKASYTLDGSRMLSACGWSPFDGMRVQGRVVGTWIRGQQVYDGEKILVAPGSGRSVFPVEAQ